MFRLITGAVLLSLLMLLLGSCTDLNPTGEDFGPLVLDDRGLTDSIPADYGDLISVTTSETYPGWAQMWFQKEDNSIVAVFLKYSTGTLRKDALLIPRS